MNLALNYLQWLICDKTTPNTHIELCNTKETNA